MVAEKTADIETTIGNAEIGDIFELRLKEDETGFVEVVDDLDIASGVLVKSKFYSGAVSLHDGRHYAVTRNKRRNVLEIQGAQLVMLDPFYEEIDLGIDARPKVKRARKPAAPHKQKTTNT